MPVGKICMCVCTCIDTFICSVSPQPQALCVHINKCIRTPFIVCVSQQDGIFLAKKNKAHTEIIRNESKDSH